MDENGLPITGAGVNYTAVEALNQRELVTYFNMFLIRTCTFLNNFSTQCESKLAKLHSRLDYIDTSIKLLETKLNSVEELKDLKIQTATAVPNPPTSTTTSVPESQQISTTQQAPQAQPVEPEATAPPQPLQEPVMVIKDDPRFASYFKMLKLGVAEPAIKLKMRNEGVNPDLLDNPDAPAPPQDEQDE